MVVAYILWVKLSVKNSVDVASTPCGGTTVYCVRCLLVGARDQCGERAGMKGCKHGGGLGRG